jgi:hypothetical protein
LKSLTDLLPPLVSSREALMPDDARMRLLGQTLIEMGPNACTVLFDFIRLYGEAEVQRALSSPDDRDFHGVQKLSALLRSLDSLMRNAITLAESPRQPEYPDHPDLESNETET